MRTDPATGLHLLRKHHRYLASRTAEAEEYLQGTMHGDPLAQPTPEYEQLEQRVSW